VAPLFCIHFAQISCYNVLYRIFIYSGDLDTMDTIKSYARFLEIICIGFICPLTAAAFMYKWFGGAMPIYNDIADCSKKVTAYYGLNLVFNPSHAQPALPMAVSRLLGAFIDSISIALLLWGCICFIRLLRYYQRGEIFTADTLALFNKMSRIAFAWALYEPVNFTLLSIITSLANPAGQRVIAVGLTSNDLVHIVIVGLFMIITSLMQEAYTLKNEHDLTV